MSGCVPYRPLYIYATTGRNLKSIRRIPQNQTFRFYLSCLVRLWRPRFSAGRGTYSPYRCPVPHPVIFSRRESDSLVDAFPVFWIPALYRYGLCLFTPHLKCRIPYSNSPTILPFWMICLSAFFRKFLFIELALIFISQSKE